MRNTSFGGHFDPTKIPYYLRNGKDLLELLPRHWAKLGTNRTD